MDEPIHSGNESNMDNSRTMSNIMSTSAPTDSKKRKRGRKLAPSTSGEAPASDAPKPLPLPVQKRKVKVNSHEDSNEEVVPAVASSSSKCSPVPLTSKFNPRLSATHAIDLTQHLVDIVDVEGKRVTMFEGGGCRFTVNPALLRVAPRRKYARLPKLDPNPLASMRAREVCPSTVPEVITPPAGPPGIQWAPNAPSEASHEEAVPAAVVSCSSSNHSGDFLRLKFSWPPSIPPVIDPAHHLVEMEDAEGKRITMFEGGGHRFPVNPAFLAPRPKYARRRTFDPISLDPHPLAATQARIIRPPTVPKIITPPVGPPVIKYQALNAPAAPAPAAHAVLEQDPTQTTPRLNCATPSIASLVHSANSAYTTNIPIHHPTRDVGVQTIPDIPPPRITQDVGVQTVPDIEPVCTTRNIGVDHHVPYFLRSQGKLS